GSMVANRWAWRSGDDHGAAGFLDFAFARASHAQSLSPGSGGLRMNRFNPHWRLQFLALLMLAGLAALLGKLWYVQVAHGPEWTKQIRGSSEATVRIPSVRGEIRDRNGMTLVQNRASYEVDFYLPEMVKGYRDRVGLPGVDISIKPVRSYVYGALASHLLGYVGAPDDTNKEEAKKYSFYQADVEGKSNIEKAMDEYLKGKPGVRYMRRNAKGQIDGVLREEPPMAGANVNLTIDARIQMIAEEALRAVGRAAAVVIDPNNGNILAMASVPSFDPNTF